MHFKQSITCKLVIILCRRSSYFLHFAARGYGTPWISIFVISTSMRSCFLQAILELPDGVVRTGEHAAEAVVPTLHYVAGSWKEKGCSVVLILSCEKTGSSCDDTSQAMSLSDKCGKSNVVSSCAIVRGNKTPRQLVCLGSRVDQGYWLVRTCIIRVRHSLHTASHLSCPMFESLP